MFNILGLGIDFITDLVKDKGQEIALQGIKKATVINKKRYLKW